MTFLLFAAAARGVILAHVPVASLSFTYAAWWLPALGVLAYVIAMLVWGYRSAQMGPWSVACPILKWTGMAALVLCLLDPLWSSQRAKPGANYFAILADNSQSLQIKDPGDSRTRGDLLRSLIEPGRNPWLENLARVFEVRRYFFDTRLQSTPDFRELVFDGRGTAIGSALRSLRERFQGRPLAGILLFTDGTATDIHSDLPDLTGVPPVYPVVMGGRKPARDLAIRDVQLTQTAFEDAPASAQVDVAAAGHAGETVVLQLVDDTGRVLHEASQVVKTDVDTLPFRFQWRPRTGGISFQRVTVRTAKDAALGPDSTDATEATLANNARVIVTDRGRGPYRVLYVSGRPNWEFKFLNRAVAADDQIQLVGLIRVAKREPKFDFRGRAGETSNPLFRGFDAQAREEVERYDQPVLVRLNTRDELELRSGFPRIPEDLYGYDALIIDDLEAEFFPPDQAALIQKFVSERGGGFLMLGGTECFEQGGYARTPIGDLLPVYLERPVEGKGPGPVKFELSREGWLNSWARIRDNESDEKTRRESMPPFSVINPVRQIKPGASVVATAMDESGKAHPALVTQRFGRGRTAALMLGDLWRWGMRDAEAHKDLDRTWRQLVRWLVADVPRRVELATEPVPDDPNGAVLLRTRVRNPKFQPMDEANVTLEIRPALASSLSPGQTNVVRLLAEPSLAEPGVFEARYVPRWSGGLLATATVTNAVGAEVGRSDAGWSSDPAAEEFRSLIPNSALLEDIARKTRGEVLETSEINSFVAGLSSRSAPVMEATIRPLWHTPFLFALALACFCIEWGIRRWKGMP